VDPQVIGIPTIGDTASRHGPGDETAALYSDLSVTSTAIRRAAIQQGLGNGQTAYAIHEKVLSGGGGEKKPQVLQCDAVKKSKREKVRARDTRNEKFYKGSTERGWNHPTGGTLSSRQLGKLSSGTKKTAQYSKGSEVGKKKPWGWD